MNPIVAVALVRGDAFHEAMLQKSREASHGEPLRFYPESVEVWRQYVRDDEQTLGAWRDLWHLLVTAPAAEGGA